MILRKLLYASACALPLLPASADNVGFVTSLPVGEKITLAVGGEARAEIHWSDGTTEKLDIIGKPLEVELKSQSFTVNSPGVIRYIFAPDAGLTSVSLNDATEIEGLYLQGNKLKSLDFGKLTNLRSLDIQGNSFTMLNVGGKCKSLEYLNCSYNSITTIATGQLDQLRTLVCAGNKIRTLSVDNLPTLRQLWCQDNGIRRLDVGKTASLHSLYAYNNSISRFSGIGGDMQRLWLDHNELEELDLSPATTINEVSVDHNSLHEVSISLQARRILKYYYANDNALSFNSFPSLKRLEAYNVSPQADYVFATSPKVGEAFSIETPFRRDAYKADADAVVTWYDKATSSKLVEGTDYSVDGHDVTFLKVFSDVYASATSELFPGIVIQTAPFKVASSTSIQTATSGCTVTAEPGKLVVTTDKAFRLRVVGTDGKEVIDATARTGRNVFNLEKGIYVVDGTKVLIP